MAKRPTTKRSQRGAALVEAALTIALIGVVSIQAVGELGKGTADKMCDNAARVYSSDLNWETDTYSFHPEANPPQCCTQSVQSNGRLQGVGSVCLPLN